MDDRAEQRAQQSKESTFLRCCYLVMDMRILARRTDRLGGRSQRAKASSTSAARARTIQARFRRSKHSPAFRPAQTYFNCLMTRLEKGGFVPCPTNPRIALPC